MTGVHRPGIVAIGGAVALIAALVLGSWWAGLAAPAAVVPGWRVMVPGSAFGFVCIGLGLAIVGAGYDTAARWLLPVLAGLAALIPDRDPRRVRQRRAMGRRALARRRLPARQRGRRPPVAGHRVVVRVPGRQPGGAASGGSGLGRRAAALRRHHVGHELAGRPRPLVRRLAPGRRAGIPWHGGADRGPAGGQQCRCAGGFGADAGPAARRPPQPGDRAGPDRRRVRAAAAARAAARRARAASRSRARGGGGGDHLRDDPGRPRLAPAGPPRNLPDASRAAARRPGTSRRRAHRSARRR